MRRAAPVMMGVLVLGAVTGLAPLAWSDPVIVQESVQLQSPEPGVGLNRAVAIHRNHLIATGQVEIPFTGFFRCVAFLFERAGAAGAWSLTRKVADFTVSAPLLDPAGCRLAVDAGPQSVALSGLGRASVFERTSAGWIETPLALPAGFAADIALAKNLVAVAGLSGETGASVVVYRRTAAGQWAFETTLHVGLPLFLEEEYRGPSVATDGRYIVIGERNGIGRGDEDPIGPTDVIVFRRDGDGRWFGVAAPADGFGEGGFFSGRDVSIASVRPNMGVTAYTDGFGGTTLFAEERRDVWSIVQNIRPASGNFFQGISSIELNALPGRVSLAASEPFPAGSGSVTVHTPRVDFDEFRPVVKFMGDPTLGRYMSFHGDTLAATGAGDQVYVFRMPAKPAIVQDDFADGNAAGWVQSHPSWTVPVSGGSRVYRQNSTTGERSTTLGQVDWTDVAIEADVRPLTFNGSDRWVSLLTRHVDATRYYWVTLRNTNVLRLGVRNGSTYTALASTALSVNANRTYRVRLEAIGTQLRVYVDGVLRLEAQDSTFQQGSVGLRTAYAQADFDNVLVSPRPAATLLTDYFQDRTLDRWVRQPTQNWSNVGLGNDTRVIRQSVASGNTRAISGIEYETADPEMADHVIEARVRAINFGSTFNPRFGLIARYRDFQNFTFVTLHRNGRIELGQFNGGSQQIFASAPASVAAGTWYRLRLEAVDDRLRVYLNGAMKLDVRDSVVDPDSTRALYGLTTWATAAEFDGVKVTAP